jgi:Domain of unknown function (DUF1963)
MTTIMREVDEKGKPVWLGSLPDSLRAQHEEIVEKLEKNGLGNYLDQIETLLRVSIELVLQTTDSPDVQGVVSRMGGEPDLPSKQTWPTWNDTPLAFLGQVIINDEIKALDLDNLLPKEGLLSFFAQIDAPEIGRHCAILHSPMTSELVRTPPPVEQTAERRPRLVLKHTALISVRGRLALPSGNAPFVDQFILDSDENDDYHDLVFLELVPPSPRHRLLGWPTAATYLDERGQLFVAQFDSDDALELEMGDVEALRMYIDGDAVNVSTLATAVSTMDEV